MNRGLWERIGGGEGNREEWTDSERRRRNKGTKEKLEQEKPGRPASK